MFTGATAVAIAIGSVIGPRRRPDRKSFVECFYINLPIGAAVTLMILVSLEVPKDSPRARLTWTEVISEMGISRASRLWIRVHSTNWYNCGPSCVSS